MAERIFSGLVYYGADGKESARIWYSDGLSHTSGNLAVADDLLNNMFVQMGREYTPDDGAEFLDAMIKTYQGGYTSVAPFDPETGDLIPFDRRRERFKT